MFAALGDFPSGATSNSSSNHLLPWGSGFEDCLANKCCGKNAGQWRLKIYKGDHQPDISCALAHRFRIDDANRFLRPIRPPSIYNVNIDSGLESIIFRCLAATPGDRYANATELLHDLEKWKPGYTPPGTSVSQSRRSAKSAIVERSPHDLKREASSALQEAIQIAQDPAQLMSAADLLEEAISKDPELRDRYEWQLQLWRKGIMHVSTADLRQFPKRTNTSRGTGR